MSMNVQELQFGKEAFRLPEREKVRVMLEEAGLQPKFEPYKVAPSDSSLLDAVRVELAQHAGLSATADAPPVPVAEHLSVTEGSSASPLELLRKKHATRLLIQK